MQTTRPIDVLWTGRPHLIAAWRVDDVLVDVGPTTCLDRLLAGLDAWRPRALLLTHIHFDHAGAAGALVRRWPDLEVFVHRKGARHLVEPTRLVASARRVFGDRFDRLFGGLDPIPESNIRVLDGGESVYGFDVIYTPGHAKHHVAYMHQGSGRGFVGDLGAVRLRPGGPILVPTPPPDIDVDVWRCSINEVAAWGPESLGLPHFGGVDGAVEHLASVDAQLQRHAQIAAAGDEHAYVEAIEAELRATVTPDEVGAYTQVVPLAQNFAGLRRWINESQGEAV